MEEDWSINMKRYIQFNRKIGKAFEAMKAKAFI